MTAFMIGLALGGVVSFRAGVSWGVRRAVSALAREDARKKRGVITRGGKGGK